MTIFNHTKKGWVNRNRFLQNDGALFSISVKKDSDFLDIDTIMVKSSDIQINHSLQSQDKVISLCEAAGEKIYINSNGGLGLYKK